jgi:hypothetical protein
MILQLNPPIPIATPKGKGLAHFLIDDGIEHHLKWVCFLDSNGECWTYTNPEIRAQKNITHGREHISPFYDPKDVKLPKSKYSYAVLNGLAGVDFYQCPCEPCKSKEENL